MDLDLVPVRPTAFRLYSERVIHGEIYKARPDVNAVVHHHAHAMLPYAISGRELLPVFHLGSVLGKVPFWDQRDEFGDTNMLVVKPEEGASLARALGPHSTVRCAATARRSLAPISANWRSAPCSAATMRRCRAKPWRTAMSARCRPAKSN